MGLTLLQWVSLLTTHHFFFSFFLFHVVLVRCLYIRTSRKSKPNVLSIFYIIHLSCILTVRDLLQISSNLNENIYPIFCKFFLFSSSIDVMIRGYTVSIPDISRPKSSLLL